MAISTLDGALAGMQPPVYFAKTLSAAVIGGRPSSFWNINGFPGNGADSVSLAGNAYTGSTTQVVGQLPRTDPVTGNAYLARLQAMATVPGTLLLCDRLWSNGGITITSTTAQTVNSVAWPARDLNGTINGLGVYVGISVNVATSTNAPTITMSYTNSNGTAGSSATNLDATTASSVAGSFFRMSLQAGDQGVRSIQSITLSLTWTAGTINMVAYRVLAALELTSANVPNAIDALTSGFPRIYNGTVPFFIFVPSSTTATAISGQYIETQG